VTFTDPHSRILRGALSGAIRRGDLDAEREMRHELKLRAIETAIVKLLDGTRLTALEVRRLRQVIEENGPQRKPAERAADEAPAEPVAV
jgi:hypothetical protein